MDADERDIVAYLKSWTGQYVSGREIAKKASTKRRFEREPDWAVPVLSRLVDKRIIEADARAHFRLLPEKEREESHAKISPELEQMLEAERKKFVEGAKIVELENPDET